MEKNNQAQINIDSISEWPEMAEIFNRLCCILYPLFTLGICAFYMITGYIRLYDVK